MNREFVRSGALRSPHSYPEWAQQLLADCAAARQRVVRHEFYQRLRDAELGDDALRLLLIGVWPVVEQFPLYMAQNLLKTRYGYQRGEDMARRFLVRNIRVEQNHADYWLAWAAACGIAATELQAQRVPEPLQQLGHWCRHNSRHHSLLLALAATNYAIEGATGEWTQLVCAPGIYEASLPATQRQSAMRWLKVHARYDDDHPWEALDIVCTLAGRDADAGTRRALQTAIGNSYHYMQLALDCCLQLEQAVPD